MEDRLWDSLKDAYVGVITTITLIQTIGAGIVEGIVKEPFYTFFVQTPWFWITACVILLLVFIGVFSYSFFWKNNTDLVELQNNRGNWNYYFHANGSVVDDESFVEIRVNHSDQCGSDLYAIAHVDRIDDKHKFKMVFNHVALYDSETNKLVRKNPETELCNKDAKKYFYRPYISDESINAFLGEV